MLIAHLLITYSLYTRIYWFRSKKSFNIILYSDWKIAIKILGKERKFHQANPYNYFQQTNHLFSFYLFIYLSIYIYILPPSLFHNLFFPTLQITFSSPSSSLPEQTQLRTRKNGAKDNRFQIAPLRTERYYVEIGKR